MSRLRLVPALVLFALTLACNRTPTAQVKESNEPLKQYAMRGVVIRLDPQGHIAVIKNEKIEGWMESMTMDFPVKDPVDFQKLQPGDTIRATVFVQGLDYWVGEVKPEGVVPAPAAQAPPAAK